MRPVPSYSVHYLVRVKLISTFLLRSVCDARFEGIEVPLPAFPEQTAGDDTSEDGLFAQDMKAFIWQLRWKARRRNEVSRWFHLYRVPGWVSTNVHHHLSTRCSYIHASLQLVSPELSSTRSGSTAWQHENNDFCSIQPITTYHRYALHLHMPC
jgi:hypothetical protein